MCLEVIWIEAAQAPFESKAKVVVKKLGTLKRRPTSDFRPRHDTAEA
jgi:hypothetical protein